MTIRLAFCLLALCVSAPGQSLIDGRVAVERWPGASNLMFLPNVLCVASLPGGEHSSAAFRTWETEPPGWFRLAGAAGNYSILFTQPGSFLPPRVLNNVFTRDGGRLLGLRVVPRFEFHSFGEKEWDTRPATGYFQTFVARGGSVTGVGFKLATDGVDGAGPMKQDLLVSIHRRGAGKLEQWPQVGPAVPVLDVDCGGPKNYTWSAAWNSGEVPLTAGETYAVRLRAAVAGGSFQAFWRPVQAAEPQCFRVGADGSSAWHERQLWMAVATDGDALRVPYNKRVQKQFGEFAGFAARWSQTYVAQGRGLAGAVLYAAVGGAQPPLSRQRVAVRVRHGGPDGPIVGVSKLAAGQGNYTGDASWGLFAVAFAPGEVVLSPGETYALEFESIETEETLRGFVNIKKQVSDNRPGFNPYRKHVRDDYASGTSFKNGTAPQDFDLDMQIIEYACVPTNFAAAVEAANLLRNGSLDDGPFDADPVPHATNKLPAALAGQGELAHWRKFSVEPGTAHAHLADGSGGFARVLGRGRVQGGWSQVVGDLSRFDTFRLSGRVRASYALGPEQQTEVGYDPTGQGTDPTAPTIVWSRFPARHGVWESFVTDPIRPATNAVSIWLRARSGATEFPFKADFDEVALRRVTMDVTCGQ